ncbi:ACR260Wp [Eremothecium gossypii ATCC 10895]|uniref:ACR260Wp n=1 Tax=Eremothecium gossypii (strain ATCC 10895 / CBS 109.51 / FGSC 9923 / NRRL Y-1056) TaxID=284811 RepID=Q75BL1_EREGS|nr:ACR260Wp [Eremothecium gossypii ATCC 10895]AAS51486.1 ACR260Wp [Eremothecium gossypii ATCC 10895]AEY95778.1 FACR260Wp [Eremothecium gossypii FDAG1]
MDPPELDYEALPENAPLVYQLAAGAFAGIMEHSIMFPIDAIKTRMQAVSTTGSSAATRLPSNMLAQIAKISTTEGSLALWKGVQSVVLGAGPAHAVYFATYEMCKSRLIDPEDRQTHQPLKTALSGTLATVAADALMNPFDTIKQRLQLHPSDSMTKCAVRMYQREGIAAFFYSYPTTIAMNIPFAALNFVIYESSTKIFNPSNNYNPWIHCLCGGISGATCAAITTPLDCVKTVLQIRGADSVQSQLFKEADTFRKAASAIHKTYGWSGFFRGLKPRIISNMPATAISWTSYEFAKHLLFTNSNAHLDNH